MTSFVLFLSFVKHLQHNSNYPQIKKNWGAIHKLLHSESECQRQNTKLGRPMFVSQENKVKK